MSHNPAVMATTYNGRYMPDGSIELTIIIPEKNVTRHTERLMTLGTNVGLVELAYKPANWGDESRKLMASGFFGRPDVWRAIGTDQDYQDWVRKQRSAFSKRPGLPDDQIVYAHVRRVADGSGTGHKPHYCGIPLLHSEHQLQHQHGESALGGKQWFDKQRVVFVVMWGWETLKKQLGYDHWTQVPPEKLLAWAEENNVERYLPKCYRNARAA